MQREDVERLAQQADALLEMDAKGALVPHGVGGLARSVISQQTAALRALLAERDAAFAAGQEEMRERAAKAYDAGMAWDTFGAFTRCLRALPIKPRP